MFLMNICRSFSIIIYYKFKNETTIGKYQKDKNTLMTRGIMELTDFNAYDLKYIGKKDIYYNPSLGTGQIQIKDVHYINYEYRTAWEMCQLLDEKYLNSSRRTIDDFYREAVKNKWIKV